MSPRGNILLWLTATAAIAALTSWLVTHRTAPPAPPAGSGADLSLHEWMHRRLNLSPAQHEALAPLEALYGSDQARLRRVIAELGKSLASALRNSAPEAAILSAQQRLHAAQGELQRVTLRHFIAMRRRLNPGQAMEFAIWTHDSLLLSPAN
jgi:hypothetical protein